MREQDDLLGQFAGVLRCCCPTNRFARTLSLRRCRLGRAFVSGDEYRWWMGGRTSCRSVVDGVLTGFSACGALVLPEPHIRTGYRRVANALRLITAGLWRAFRVRIGLSGFVSGFPCLSPREHRRMSSHKRKSQWPHHGAKHQHLRKRVRE